MSAPLPAAVLCDVRWMVSRFDLQLNTELLTILDAHGQPVSGVAARRFGGIDAAVVRLVRDEDGVAVTWRSGCSAAGRHLPLGADHRASGDYSAARAVLYCDGWLALTERPVAHRCDEGAGHVLLRAA